MAPLLSKKIGSLFSPSEMRSISLPRFSRSDYRFIAGPVLGFDFEHPSGFIEDDG